MILIFNISSSLDKTITLPIHCNPGDTVTVDWDDSTSDNYTSTGDYDHTYLTTGTYNVTISGQLRQFGNGGTGYANNEKLVGVSTFGSLPTLTSLSGAFYLAANLTSVPSSLPSSITDLSYLFASCTSLDDSNISSWDTSNVTNMSYLFSDALIFNQSISSWDTSSVTDMSYMFAYTNSFNQSLSTWDTSNVTNMEGLFRSASSFNQPLSSWNTLGVTNMKEMFRSATNFNQSVSSFDTSNVTDLSLMFAEATNFTYAGDLGSWNVSNVTTMDYIFSLASALDPVIKRTDYDAILSGWSLLPSLQSGITLDVGITPYSSGSIPSRNILTTTYSWILIDGGLYEPLIINFNITSPSDKTITLPIHCNPGDTVWVEWGDSTSDTYTSTGDYDHIYPTPGIFGVEIFGKLTQLGNGSSGYSNVSKVRFVSTFGNMPTLTSLSGLFYNASNLISVPVSLPSTIINLSYCFYGSLILSDASISSWNTTNVTTLESTFQNAILFNESLNSWNTTNITTMKNMFAGASSFNQPLNLWNTSNVTTMESMFSGASLFSYVSDLGSWNISNVENMTNIFNVGLTYITISRSSYDSILQGWAALPSLQPGVTFDVGAIQYSSSSLSARNTIISSGWTLLDGGLYEPLIITFNIASPSDKIITIPIHCNPGDTVTVYWGDSTFNDYTSTGNYNYEYSSLGTFDVEISGQIRQLGNGSLGYPNTEKIISSSTFGNLPTLLSLSGLFYNALNLISVPSSLPSAITDLSYCFYGCSNLNDSNVSSWSTTNITTMKGLFYNATIFNQSLNSWITNNVTDMEELFYGSDFNQSLSTWNTSNVTTMKSMFRDTTSFNQSLSTFDTSGVTNMESIFRGAAVFNQPLNTWNVSNVINMKQMFQNALFFNQTLSSWDVSNVTNMQEMFSGASGFTYAIDLALWNVSNVTNMNNMLFDGVSYIPITQKDYNAILQGWSSLPSLQSGVTFDVGITKYYSFYTNQHNIITSSGWTLYDGGPLYPITFTFDTTLGTNKFITLPLKGTIDVFINWGDSSTETQISEGLFNHEYASDGIYNVEIYGFFSQFGNGLTGYSNVEKLTELFDFGDSQPDSLSGAFYNAINLTSVPSILPSTVSNLSYTFMMCTNFNQGSVSNWDISAVTNMASTFYGAALFNQSLNSWNTLNVTDMSSLFAGASAFNQELYLWNTSSVTNMSDMFYNATSFDQNIDGWNVSNVVYMQNMFRGTIFNYPLSSWDTSSVVNMSSMFQDNTIFDSEIKFWNVTNVSDMSKMFQNASSFNQQLDLWQTDSLTTTNSMFYGASSFNQTINTWNTSNVTDMKQMFMDATSFNQQLSSWDTSNVTNMQQMFQNTTSFNRPLNLWNTINVTTMDSMLYNATNFQLSSLVDWDVRNVSNMDNIIYGLTMLSSDYSAILIAWEGLPSLQSNVTFNVGGTTFLVSASIPRTNIVNNYSWTIIDGGLGGFTPMSLTYTLTNPLDLTITLPLQGTILLNVSWGDSTSDYYTTVGDKDHTYPSTGTYTVELSGVLTQFGNGSTGYANVDKLTYINTFGDMGLESLSGGFKDAINLTSIPPQIPITLTNLEYAFYGATSFNDSNVLSWNTTNITNLNYIFFNASAFNQDIFQWEIPNITTYNFVLFGASIFNKPVSGWLLNKILNFP